MASVKDKLSQLGRKVKKITLTSIDGTQTVDAFYQCLTTLKERILREAMREQFDAAVDEFKTPKKEGDPSMYDRWKKEFAAVGAEKCARFIVANDSQTIRTDTLREMGREPLAPGATQEEEDAYRAEFIPIFERIVEDNVAAIKDEDIDSLAEQCVDIQVQAEANAKAYATYRLRLIQESILQEVCDDKGEPVVPTKYELAFGSADEIEEFLATTTIDELSKKIADEVREAKAVPLTSVSTN